MLCLFFASALTCSSLSVCLSVCMSGTRVTGVEYFVGSSSSSAVRRAHAGLETVLAAGAIGSPQLLMLSGEEDDSQAARQADERAWDASFSDCI